MYQQKWAEKRRLYANVAVVGLILALAATACSAPFGIGGEEGNPLPTPQPGIDVGAEAESAARETPEETWEVYLEDSIAEQVARQEGKITLLERYQDPAITAQNLGGTVTDIDLVEDRTEFNIRGGTLAFTQTEFDVRLTFANGDTDTRTCAYDVSMEFNEDDGVWYVVNPQELAVFVVCG
jgi:hypothetical protein